LHRGRRGVARGELGAGGDADALLHRHDAVAVLGVENRPREPRIAARAEVAVVAALYATEEDRLAELWRPAKRVALRLALRSTDAG
jgi:hypothetical protein